jgi:hypothetical protein
LQLSAKQKVFDLLTAIVANAKKSLKTANDSIANAGKTQLEIYAEAKAANDLAKEAAKARAAETERAKALQSSVEAAARKKKEEEARKRAESERQAAAAKARADADSAALAAATLDKEIADL